MLETGDRFFEELQAYKKQYVSWQSRSRAALTRCFSFEPLVTAVQEEDDKAWESRLQEWNTERLEREGYALTRLGGTWVGTEGKGKNPRHVACFTKLGKEATRDFSWNRLE